MYQEPVPEYLNTDPRVDDDVFCWRQYKSSACVAPPDSAEPQTDEQAAKTNLTEEKAQTSSATSQDAGYPAVLNKDLNRRIALLSSLATVGLFASQRLDLGGPSLKDIAANAIPYEESMSVLMGYGGQATPVCLLGKLQELLERVFKE